MTFDMFASENLRCLTKTKFWPNGSAKNLSKVRDRFFVPVQHSALPLWDDASLQILYGCADTAARR